jgi:hypothetical protein
VQDDWTGVVWNSNHPWFTQHNRVDLYLYRADSGQEILHFRNVVNTRNQSGFKQAMANDSWWGDDGPNWNGQNQTFPFYWTVVNSDTGMDGQGAPIPQATFNAVQTTLPASVIASISSASASQASASASAASASSQSVASSLSADSTRSAPGETGTNSGALQPGSHNSDFPDWAIAVIVILGFFAIAALGVLIFIIIRRVKRREQESNRNSMGSSSPMMAHVQSPSEPHSPLLGNTFAGGATGAAGGALVGGVVAGGSSHGHNQPSTSGGHQIFNDGASTISRANSAGESGPFSGADAAIMAEAFRKALRKPDFVGRPVEEGDSPDSQGRNEGLINRELAEEGRDIRSVASSRGVRVETLSDNGSTVQDHH